MVSSEPAGSVARLVTSVRHAREEPLARDGSGVTPLNNNDPGKLGAAASGKGS